MHKKDNTTLEKLFSHPLNMNLEWNEIKHLLESLGATVETTNHGHIKVTLGSDVKTFKTFHKMLGDKHEIIELQHMLRKAGFAIGSSESH
jgi:hypothetical protein